MLSDYQNIKKQAVMYNMNTFIESLKHPHLNQNLKAHCAEQENIYTNKKRFTS